VPKSTDESQHVTSPEDIWDTLNYKYNKQAIQSQTTVPTTHKQKCCTKKVMQVIQYKITTQDVCLWQIK